MEIRGENVQEICTDLIPLEVWAYRNKTILRIERITKRAIDVIGSIFGIIALLPLTLIIWIANLITGDKGPLFYFQERIGKNGKIFRMYKYRSMVVGAEKKLKQYLKENEEARKEYNKYKKLKHDPRITKIGNFIRRTSLDEFPQFINVLKGEMSLVGPRPYLPEEKEGINGYFNYITSVKPGITGYWQVNGRSNVTFIDRLDMDMQYFYNHSLKLDIKILKQTVEKIIDKEGAI